MTKVQDIVRDLLINYPELRNDDKKLVWAVWTRKQLVQVSNPPAFSMIMYMNFMQAPSFETIRRT